MTRLQSRSVVTRKPHQCLGCKTNYPKGTKLFSVTEAYDDGIETYYLCDRCDKVTQDMESGDFWIVGELKEHWETEV